MAILPAITTPQTRSVPLTKPPPTRSFISNYSNPRKRKLAVEENGGDADGAVKEDAEEEGAPTGDGSGARRRKGAKQGSGQVEDDEEAVARGGSGSQAEEEPWQDSDFLLSKQWNLHRLTPMHAFPVPDTPAALISCRDLRAYLARRLADTSATFIASESASLVPRIVEMGFIDLGAGSGLKGAVGWEVEFATPWGEAAHRTARFVLLPPTTALAANQRLPEGISYFPLLLTNAGSPALEAQFLDWMEGRFDCKITRPDAATGGGWSVGQEVLHAAVEAAAEAYVSEAPSTRDLNLVFKAPSPTSAYAHTLSFPAAAAELLVRASRKTLPSSPPPSALLGHLASQLAKLNSVSLKRFNIVNATVGHIGIAVASASGESKGEPVVRFYKGTETPLGERGDEASVMVKVLRILRNAAEMK